MLETLESQNGTQGGENPSVTKPISREANAAFIAAFLEGEGTIHAGVEDRSKRNLGPMLRLAVRLTNNNYLLLNKGAQILLDEQIPFCWTLDPRDGLKGKACANIHIAGKKRIKKFLEFVLPHMSSKKRQAELMLDLINYRESLVLSSKRDTRGELMSDPKIVELIKEIKTEKHNYPSVINFSRQPNQLLIQINPSTTTRSSTV